MRLQLRAMPAAICAAVLSSALLALTLASSVAMAAGPPEVGATWVSNVGTNTATLHAEINPNGTSTRFNFEFLTDAHYEANIVAGEDGYSGASSVPSTNNGLGAGIGFQQVSFVLVGPANPLTPATSYRYRAVASNTKTQSATGATHLFTTQASGGAPGLPDSRVWELVSPLDKGGGGVAAPATLFGGGYFQAAAISGALTFSSATASADPDGAPPASQYISRRSSSSWATENISAPLLSGAYGDEPDGAPTRFFDQNLGISLLYGGDPCLGVAACPNPAPPLSNSGAPLGYRTFYLRSAAGSYLSLLKPTDIANTSVAPGRFELQLGGATADLSHIYFETCAALTADATETVVSGSCDPSRPNLYSWSDGQLSLVNRPPSGVLPPTPGRLAAPIGAASDDGSRVYWQETGGGLFLNEGGVSRPVPLSDGAVFQAASIDGAFAYFLRGSTLYRYSAATDASGALATLVSGVLAISPDGTRVYYQTSSGLWTRNQNDSPVLIAAGSEAAAPSDYPPASGTTRLSADGTRLAFLSSQPISEYDNGDADTGDPQTEVYLYDAITEGLLCASCNQTGERPQGEARIPGALVNGSTRTYRPRALSANGKRLFFETTDDLANDDTNNDTDVYQWEAAGEGNCALSRGCVSLISAGRSSASAFLDAPADGSDVYFLTADSLVASDPGSADVYDARINGGLPEPQPPIPCLGDACQPLPSPPSDPTAGTSLPGSGNPAPKYFKEHKKKHHHKHKKHHHRKHTHHQRSRR
jgi:hypothetical protein